MGQELRFRVVQIDSPKRTVYIAVVDEFGRQIVVSMSHNRKRDVTWVVCENCDPPRQLGRWEGFATVDVEDVAVGFDLNLRLTSTARARKRKQINTGVYPVVEAHFREHYPG